MGTPGPEPGSQIDGLFQLFWFVLSCTIVQKDLTAKQYSRLLYVAYIYSHLKSCEIKQFQPLHSEMFNGFTERFQITLVSPILFFSLMSSMPAQIIPLMFK